MSLVDYPSDSSSDGEPDAAAAAVLPKNESSDVPVSTGLKESGEPKILVILPSVEKIQRPKGLNESGVPKIPPSKEKKLACPNGSKECGVAEIPPSKEEKRPKEASLWDSKPQGAPILVNKAKMDFKASEASSTPFWASKAQGAPILVNKAKMDFKASDPDYTYMLVLNAVLNHISTENAASRLMAAERSDEMVSSWIIAVAQHEEISVNRHIEIALKLAEMSPDVFKSAIMAAKDRFWSAKEAGRLAEFLSSLMKANLLTPDANSLRITEDSSAKEVTIVLEVLKVYLKDKTKQEIEEFFDAYVCGGQLKRRMLLKITRVGRALR